VDGEKPSGKKLQTEPRWRKKFHTGGREGRADSGVSDETGRVVWGRKRSKTGPEQEFPAGVCTSDSNGGGVGAKRLHGKSAKRRRDYGLIKRRGQKATKGGKTILKDT